MWRSSQAHCSTCLQKVENAIKTCEAYPSMDDSTRSLTNLCCGSCDSRWLILHRRARYLAPVLLLVDQLVASLTEIISRINWNKKQQ